MDDLISRLSEIRSNYNCMDETEEPYYRALSEAIQLASAQLERLTDDDFETIRIHLNAQKEKLCNQRRWEEAEEYQRIIDRFMAFASAQPERTGKKMTNAEAIETLIANYPDACFEQLREAVDAAIEALKAQPETIRPAWKADDRYIKTMFQPFPYCPKCNHYLITGDNYCSVCGRHIDWSEDDDTAD